MVGLWWGGVVNEQARQNFTPIFLVAMYLPPCPSFKLNMIDLDNVGIVQKAIVLLKNGPAMQCMQDDDGGGESDGDGTNADGPAG